VIDVVLPCLNEAAALPAVLSRLPNGYRAVVADNGSTDGSADVARRYGAEVVSVPQRGFGAAVHAGLISCSSDVVCVLDADGSLDPEQLPKVADPVLRDEADLVVGRRRPVSGAAWPWHGRVGNAVLARHIRRQAGVRLSDLGPMRAFRRAEMLGLPVRDRRFGYPLEVVLLAANAGWRIAEVDVLYGPRAAGTRSKVTGSVRGTLTAARDMAAVLTR
jgi:glycosyltransferase involved in cell wall biosynthesis